MIAQDDSVFSDAELADIEGPALDDDALEKEFDTFSEEGDADNFDKEEFEEFGDEYAEQQAESGESLEEGDDFDKDNYEVISDRPGYEVVSDADIEREFQEGFSKEEPAEGDEFVGEEYAEQLEEDAEPEVGDEDADAGAGDEDIDAGVGDEDADAGVGDEDADAGVGDEDADAGVEDDFGEEYAEQLESDATLNLITNIRYLSEKDQIVIDSSEVAVYEPRENIETNQYIIEIFQAKLGDNLHFPYILRDFETQFGMLKADQKDSNTVRVIIQLREGAEFPKSVQPEDSNQIIIGFGAIVDNNIVESSPDDQVSGPILPATTLKDLYFGDIPFSGTPISLHVIDAPIKQVLRFISEESGLNMVIGEKVTGSITLKLEDVPWDQVLHTILKFKSLGYTRDGNIVAILPLEEIEKRTKKLKEISDRQKSLAPYITKVIPVNYGKMSDIAGKVKDFSTKGTDYVKPGQVITHPESNTFVVIDTEEVVKKIEAVIRYLDQAPKQVMVEAKIVEAQENFTKKFGLNWNVTGNFPVRLNESGFLDFFKGITGGYRTVSSGNARLNLNNLPIIGNLQASLDLAESNNYAQVISTPKVVVLSGKSASINRNSPILIDKSTTTTTTAGGDISQNTNKETMDVSISLKVQPTVTSTGSVFLQVDVTRSDPGAGSTSGEVGGALAVNRTAKTEVLVKNGETIVIGGLYEKNETHGGSGIPILKDIPFVNMLFNKKAKATGKSELLVFITPRLLDRPD